MTEETKPLRDKRGRFVKGGPSPHPQGRPKREIEVLALSILAEKLDIAAWGAIVEAMIKRAKSGDVAAFRALADYFAGKPTERIAVAVDETPEVILSFPTAIKPMLPDSTGETTDHA